MLEPIQQLSYKFNWTEKEKRKKSSNNTKACPRNTHLQSLSTIGICCNFKTMNNGGFRVSGFKHQRQQVTDYTTYL